jgi:hypothetical protein
MLNQFTKAAAVARMSLRNAISGTCLVDGDGRRQKVPASLLPYVRVLSQRLSTSQLPGNSEPGSGSGSGGPGLGLGEARSLKFRLKSLDKRTTRNDVEDEDKLFLELLKDTFQFPHVGRAEVLLIKYPSLREIGVEGIAEMNQFLTQNGVTLDRLLRMPWLLTMSKGQYAA